MVYVTALPCKILITTFAICLYNVYYHIWQQIQKNCTLVTIHVKKQHNKELGHITEMLSMVIKDLLLHAHCCHELLETEVSAAMHSNDYPAAREYPSLENK